MNVVATALPGVVVIEPKIFRDARGSFRTIFRVDEFADRGVEHRFVQDNVSVSRGGVVRGLHFQNPKGQGKLVYALAGSIFDVAVDVRVNSPTFGRAVWTELSSDNGRQLFIPPGFAHGFAVTSDEAVVAYKCTELYAPECEQAIRWDDPAIGIPWPIRSPVLSERDASAPLLADLPRDRLPQCA